MYMSKIISGLIIYHTLPSRSSLLILLVFLICDFVLCIFWFYFFCFLFLSFFLCSWVHSKNLFFEYRDCGDPISIIDFSYLVDYKY